MENNMEPTRTAQLDELMRRIHESQDCFVANLREMTVDEILSWSFEYSFREDIIHLLEEIEGPAEEVADLLLQLKDPLASIFDTLCWKGLESWNDLIATAVDATAEQVSLQCRYQKLTEGSAE